MMMSLQPSPQRIGRWSKHQCYTADGEDAFSWLRFSEDETFEGHRAVSKRGRMAECQRSLRNTN